MNRLRWMIFSTSLLTILATGAHAEEQMLTDCATYATCTVSCADDKFGLELQLENGGVMVYCGLEDKTPDGLAVMFHKDGSKAAVATFTGGMLSGPYKRFDSEGRQRSTCDYVSGVKEGVCVDFDVDGKERRRETFVNGKLDGPMMRMYASGQHQIEATFSAGLAQGTWTEWSEAGEMTLRCEYDQGALVDSADRVGTCPDEAPKK